LSDRNEQLEPLNLNKGKAVTDGIGCLMGNIGSCLYPLQPRNNNFQIEN
jgi:hypothetical protein